MIRDYYEITKPGIIYGNIITVVAGFVLASSGNINFSLLIATVFGISFVMASGCVFNNCIDRDIDALMERTKDRVLVRKRIPLRNACMYGSVLGILGVYLLTVYTNILTATASLVGLFVYVVIYSLWLKRSSVHHTIVGSIAGAMPLVVGYLAVTGKVDVGVIILFFVLSLWQMPHAFAIALYRLSDYKAASIPVLPLVKGVRATKIQMVIYTILFVISTLLLTVYGYAGKLYYGIMGILGFLFIIVVVKGLYIKTYHDNLWARKVFLFSIIVLVVFCVTIIVDRLIS